eukprot:3597543-Pyramimonas_sp.AAC.1
MRRYRARSSGSLGMFLTKTCSVAPRGAVPGKRNSPNARNTSRLSSRARVANLAAKPTSIRCRRTTLNVVAKDYPYPEQ